MPPSFCIPSSRHRRIDRAITIATGNGYWLENCIRTLHRLYANALIEYRRIAPRDIGAPPIGHFGFFRPQFSPTLWPLVPQWLRDYGFPRDSPQSC